MSSREGNFFLSFFVSRHRVLRRISFRLVDAAHNIGQLPVSLRTVEPDFWISNCHKWLLAHRGCAVLYVNKRLQHLVHSIPISHYYKVRTRETASRWIEEFVVSFIHLISNSRFLLFFADSGDGGVLLEKK